MLGVVVDNAWHYLQMYGLLRVALEVAEIFESSPSFFLILISEQDCKLCYAALDDIS